MARENLFEVLLGQRPKSRKEGPSHAERESFLSGRNPVRQDAKKEAYKVCQTNRKGIIVAGVE